MCRAISYTFFKWREKYSCGHYKDMLVPQKTVLDILYPGPRGFS